MSECKKIQDLEGIPESSTINMATFYHENLNTTARMLLEMRMRANCGKLLVNFYVGELWEKLKYVDYKKLQGTIGNCVMGRFGACIQEWRIWSLRMLMMWTDDMALLTYQS